DVPLAQQFMQRIVGLRAGRVVFDGPPERLTHAALTVIYGEEDWNEMRRGDEEQSSAEADARARMAALAR
ncbi:MAG: phosphonate ABC transporter ATP-binding protein, partial [Roseicyclus sp.]